MAVSVERFLKYLNESGILSSEDLLGLKAQIPEEKHKQDAKILAQELVRTKKLTFFQANALYKGKPEGLTLGNYVLLEEIGAGGMGMVFKAEHRRMKRIVAVKVLPPEAMKDPNVVKRFLREAEAAAKLTHPHIVAAHDADECKGVHFLVMEYVDGVDLASQIREHGVLPPDKALDYILQAAKGLEHAHKQGIIHRDIKPANLLLDKQGIVKILDMGLARIQEGSTPGLPIAEAAALTQVGSIMGTVDYMSPEQGIDSRHATPAADVYSLGATFFFLLMARPPYPGESIVARLVAHREAPIPSLSGERSDVPPQFDAIFRRMLAKKKEDRYPSMTELIHDLTNWRDVTPTGSSSAAGGATSPPAGAGGIPQDVISAIFDD